MYKSMRAGALIALFALPTVACFAQEADENVDKELAADLKLLQGSWELMHGNEGKGAPTVQSIKVIDGNKETLRRFNAKTGVLLHEHSVQIKLSKSGHVRVMTFFPVGGSPEQGLSYVYKLDKDDFYDIPGLLHGDEYRNYQNEPKIWHWKRLQIPGEKKDESKSNKEPTE